MKKFNKKWIYIIIAVVVVIAAAAAWFIISRQSTASATLAGSLQTVNVEKGTLTATIGANGTVRSNQSAMVSWQTSGRVADVNVKVGQAVKADEVLMTLDPTSLSQSLLQAQADLLNAKTALDDLKNPSALSIAQAESALKSAQDALDELKNPTSLSIAQAETTLKNAQDAVDELKNPTPLAISQAEQAVIDAQKSVDDAQYAVDSAKDGRGSAAQIAQARADVLLAQDQVNKMQDFYDRVPGDPSLNKSKAQALTTLENAKTSLDKAKAKLEWYLTAPTALEVAERLNTLAVAQAQLQDAQDTLEKLKSPTAEDIALAEAKVSDAQDALDNLKNPSAADISLSQAKVEDAQKSLDKLTKGPDPDELATAQSRVDIAQATLNLARLTAPFDGTITNLNANPGDMVSLNTAAYRIDDLTHLYVDLQVSEVDINRVQEGQPVQISFDAILGKKYNGKVTAVGQFGTATSGVVNFTVTVQLTDADESVKPGMTAAASIVVSQIENVLLVPNQSVRTVNNKRVVYKANGSGIPQAVEIEISASSDTMSALVDGSLKEGDAIILNPSTDLMSMRPAGAGAMFGGGN
jgi:HlyD family secretion protein